MIKKNYLKDYLDKDFTYLDGVPVSLMGEVWAKILRDRVNKIHVNDNEFYNFVLYFINQLPYNWDKKSFMSVKIIRIK